MKTHIACGLLSTICFLFVGCAGDSYDQVATDGLTLKKELNSILTNIKNVETAKEAVAKIDPALRLNCFGHLGDGNLHYNVFPPDGQSNKAFANRRNEVKEVIHDLVHAHGGSISAEHGIGRFKTEDLVKYGDPTKVAAMRAIKAALDPAGIMNPGAVLD